MDKQRITSFDNDPSLSSSSVNFSSSTSEPPSSRPTSFRDLLIDFFRIYDPSRLSDIDDLLLQYYQEDTPLISSSVNTSTGSTNHDPPPSVPKNTNEGTTTTADEPVDDTDTVHKDLYTGYRNLICTLEEQYRVPGAFTTYICNVRSQYYQPLVSLYTPGFVPPYPFVIPFDNLHKASVLVPVEKAQTVVRFGVLHGSETKSQDNLWKSGTLPPGLFDWLASTDSKGPLSILQSYYHAHDRICLTIVTTPSGLPTNPSRHHHQQQQSTNPNVIYDVSDQIFPGTPQRMYMMGYLRGFDNHWNIILNKAIVIPHHDVYSRYQYLPRSQQQQQPVLSQEKKSTNTDTTSTGITFHEYLHQQDPYYSGITDTEFGKRKYPSSSAAFVSPSESYPSSYPVQEQIFIPGYHIVAVHKLSNVIEPPYKVKIKLER